jgi:hypothetical protein
MSWTERNELNQETLEKLKSESLLREQPQEVYSRIIQEWQFPLYGLELGEEGKESLLKELTRQDEARAPDE